MNNNNMIMNNNKNNVNSNNKKKQNQLKKKNNKKDNSNINSFISDNLEEKFLENSGGKFWQIGLETTNASDTISYTLNPGTYDPSTPHYLPTLPGYSASSINLNQYLDFKSDRNIKSINIDGVIILDDDFNLSESHAIMRYIIRSRNI